MTAFADDRIRDLYTTAAELRYARSTPAAGPRLHGLRLRLGTILLHAGTALGRGARPAAASRLAR
ncbi:MAG: hypothetical protein HY264_00850 [Chloroflexi bacterium]|nr:hypothetical protein [Chloroflexota bacterium]